MPQLALRGTKGLRHPKVDLYFPHIKLCEGWPWTWNLNDSNKNKLEQTEIYLQMIHFPLPIWLYPECKLWDMVGSQPAHTSLQPKIYLLNSIICKFIHYHFPSFPPEHPYSSLLTPLQNCRYPPPRHMLSCHQHQLHRYQQWVDHVLLPSGWHLPDPRCHNKQPQRIHLNQTNDGGGGIEIDCWLVNVNENQVCFFWLHWGDIVSWILGGFLIFGRKWSGVWWSFLRSDPFPEALHTPESLKPCFYPQQPNELSIPRWNHRPCFKLTSFRRHGVISPVTSMMIFFDFPLKNCKSCGQRYVQAQQLVQCLCPSTSPVRLEGFRTWIVDEKLALKMLEVWCKCLSSPEIQ